MEPHSVDMKNIKALTQKSHIPMGHELIPVCCSILEEPAPEPVLFFGEPCFHLFTPIQWCDKFPLRRGWQLLGDIPAMCNPTPVACFNPYWGCLDTTS